MPCYDSVEIFLHILVLLRVDPLEDGLGLPPEFKGHLSLSPAVNGGRKLQDFLWPSLPDPFWSFPAHWICEELQAVSAENVFRSSMFSTRSALPSSFRRSRMGGVLFRLDGALLTVVGLKRRSACVLPSPEQSNGQALPDHSVLFPVAVQVGFA